ncbi:hypothetical protein BX661DRAFT_53494 [Kickxella alabastrina]|uniref:uncharacterized protein n=1 Tax=Kickxella alabastrina TaxID=61397 RepID=UPI002220CEA9|nr:uncharacterized protein BX661DRAFT_53494 [Kickxella alabastrina]KAI7823977.1 hypothetical protein BX661DRAFT_53494 [Kickxella alabastrina]
MWEIFDKMKFGLERSFLISLKSKKTTGLKSSVRRCGNDRCRYIYTKAQTWDLVYLEQRIFAVRAWKHSWEWMSSKLFIEADMHMISSPDTVNAILFGFGFVCVSILVFTCVLVTTRRRDMNNFGQRLLSNHIPFFCIVCLSWLFIKKRRAT